MADAAQNPIRFTPAQAAAISARGGSLLVSAAAGSGKTRVLVERVVGLITDPGCPAEADSLLIMTLPTPPPPSCGPTSPSALAAKSAPTPTTCACAWPTPLSGWRRAWRGSWRPRPCPRPTP